MQHPCVILRFLLPADQDSTESIHPAVGPFRHPAAGLEPCGPSNQLRFLATRTNVRREPELPRQITYFVKVIPFVQTQALRLLQRRSRSFHRNAFHRLPRQLEVVDVRSRDGQSHRDAVRFDQQTSLGAGFGSIRGIRTGFSPPPAAPSSSPHPCSAKTSPTPSVRHILPVRFATISGTPPPASIPETAGGRSSSNKSPWHSTHSIDSRSEARTGARPSHPDRLAGVVPGPGGLRSRAPATTAPQTPKTHPNTAIDSIASLHPPFRASMPERFIDHLPVFGIGSYTWFGWTQRTLQKIPSGSELCVSMTPRACLAVP